MTDIPRQWLEYAEDNLGAAQTLLEAEFFNPCLQNCQQAVEKALKAVMVKKSMKLARTHSIEELRNRLTARGVAIGVEDDDCELLDSIFIPSRYPMENALPSSIPNREICVRCVTIAEQIVKRVRQVIVLP